VPHSKAISRRILLFRYRRRQPAAGDKGLAIGAALHTYHSILKQPRRYQMKNSYLGPEFSDSRIEGDLKKASLTYRKLEREPLLEAVVEQIAAGNVVGWFEGRMEWGPRALGNRSIVTHTGLPDMKAVLNPASNIANGSSPLRLRSLLNDNTNILNMITRLPSCFTSTRFVRRNWPSSARSTMWTIREGYKQSAERKIQLYYDLIQTFERKTGFP
jgi:predicted NodU family carbamoyl transferase